ncbi:hypothetical protein RFI_34863 [Reticulomyxa filosa]|uniref:Uncharacterized protein n=1 Tax=Reticulomyxa filosa TaxID=46433 RepID=X6LP92_RETFI|nr:hypothetical protein RFI_34863 [Reticulomyxa filosa]|eukprot:ETO02555.1 hypothetical protein RFI_34863 [Reticulomyxa filosa]
MSAVLAIVVDSGYEVGKSTCWISIPYWLLICGVMLGDLIYGFGFFYVFWRGYKKSMHHVRKSITAVEVQKNQQHMRQHLIAYSVQAVTALLCYVVLLYMQLSFVSVLFWEMDLTISNVCVYTLFQRRKGSARCKQCHCTWTHICGDDNNGNHGNDNHGNDNHDNNSNNNNNGNGVGYGRPPPGNKDLPSLAASQTHSLTLFFPNHWKGGHSSVVAIPRKIMRKLSGHSHDDKSHSEPHYRDPHDRLRPQMTNLHSNSAHSIFSECFVVFLQFFFFFFFKREVKKGGGTFYS